MKNLIISTLIALSFTATAGVPDQAARFEFCEITANKFANMQQIRRNDARATPSYLIDLNKRVYNKMVADGSISREFADAEIKKLQSVMVILFDYDSMVSADYVFRDILHECLRHGG